MRILLDVDGVLGDFVTEVVEFCNKYERTLGSLGWTPDNVTEFDILRALKCEHLQARLDLHMAESDFCRHMPVYDGAPDFVAQLRGLGEVVIVTSPYSAVPTWSHARLAWLEEHFSIPKHDVIFAKRKELIRGDVLIDDKTENCEAFNRASSYRGAILFDRPWNQKCKLPRAKSYTEALAMVGAK